MQPGDTLSAIAKKFLGNANEYMDIFNANRDQLIDPDMIKPGQVLKIPVRYASIIALNVGLGRIARAVAGSGW